MTRETPPLVRDRSRFRRFWPDRTVTLAPGEDAPEPVVTTETLIDRAQRARLAAAQSARPPERNEP